MSQNEKANEDVHKKLPKELEWQVDTPFLDRFTAVGIAKLLVIYAVLSAVVLFLSPYTFILIVLTLIFAMLISLVIFGSQRRLHFRIDGTGAGFTIPTRIGGANKIIGYLTLILGIANGRPGAVVVGATAASQPSMSSRGWGMEWKDVREAAFYLRERVVILKEKRFTGGLGGGLASLRLYCTLENYETVAAIALANTQKRKSAHKTQKPK